MLQKIKDWIFPPELEEFKVDFAKENARSLNVLILAGLFLTAGIFLAQYIFRQTFSFPGRTLEYLLFFCVSVAIFLTNRRESIKGATGVLYAWIALLFAWSLQLVAGDKTDYPTFVFMFLLIALPLLIRDAWGRIVILIALVSLAFVIIDGHSRPPEIFFEDMLHLIICLVAVLYLSRRINAERVHYIRTSSEAETEAERDGLTGIYNRRGGEQMIRAYVANGMPGAFLMIDVDDFKYVNDNYGHAAGDETLKSVAKCLKHCFRESDVVMRMGGDEFIVYAVGMADNRHVGEKLAFLKKKLHEIKLGDSETDHVTASIGCIINLGSYPTYEALSTAADKLLYVVKLEGKDNYKFSDIDYKPSEEDEENQNT